MNVWLMKKQRQRKRQRERSKQIVDRLADVELDACMHRPDVM